MTASLVTSNETKTDTTPDETADDLSSRRGLSRAWAAALASLAYIVPVVVSRPTTPSPDHPKVMLWYSTLREPAIQPPDVVIPIAWTAIETGLAYAGYRLLRKAASPARTRALALLGVNLLGIGGWSALFFGKRDLPLATVAAAALGVTSAIYVNEARKVDTRAAVASVPLVLWVGFATVLTAAIWRRNR